MKSTNTQLHQKKWKDVKRQSSSQDACTLASPSSKDCTVALKFISHGIESVGSGVALFYSARLGLHEAGPPTRNTHLHLREILGISVVQSRVEILKRPL